MRCVFLMTFGGFLRIFFLNFLLNIIYVRENFHNLAVIIRVLFRKMAKRMAVRVKVFEKCEYIEITEEMLTNYESFIRHGKKNVLFLLRHKTHKNIYLSFFLVMEKFDLDPSQAAETYMFDQNNFRIPIDLYSVVMPQFLSPAVYIKLVFNLDENTGFDMVKLNLILQHESNVQTKIIFM